MLNYSDYRKPVVSEAGEALEIKIGQIVDDFVKQLKAELVSSDTKPRGLWDRFKNWWSNRWYGRYNQKNPYFWMNKLGDDLGRPAESVTNRPTLSEYRQLRSLFDTLESELNEQAGTEKLVIMQKLDKWAAQLRQALVSAVMSHTPPGDTPSAAPPASPPGPKDTPPSAPPEDKTAPLPASDAGKTVKTGELDDLEPPSGSRKTTPTPLPETPPGPPPSDVAPTPLRKPKLTDVSPPDTGNKKWADLTATDKEEWDRVGGGKAEEASPALKKIHGIRSLPYILRLGDPRREAIHGQSKQHVWNRLVRQGRVETPGEPIRTTDDLRKRKERAMEAMKADTERLSGIRKEQAKRRQAAGVKEPAAAPPPPTPTTEPRREEPPPTTAREEPPAEAVPSPVKTAELTPPPGHPELTPVDAADEEDMSAKQDRLMQELDSLAGVIRDKLFRRLEKMVRSGDPEKLKKADMIIGGLTSPKGDEKEQDFEIEQTLSLDQLTLSERAKVFKNRLRNHYFESRPAIKVNLSEVKTDKVDYLKGLLKKQCVQS